MTESDSASAVTPTVTDDTPVRVRFCPSPTGTPHVGLIRTALFNWAYARHTGGTFIFRVEDTDAARDSEESYHQMLDGLKWLGIDWDEGVEVGGPDEPYRQSERADIYQEVIGKLKAAGHIYESYSTPEEVEERHRAAGRDVKLGYDNYDRDLTHEQIAGFRAEGREAVLRLRMPDDDVSFTDAVRGDITFKAGTVPDFAVVRANGKPLYTLVNPVDDALMRVTHVLRGEDLLSSTPRQIALYRALLDVGVAQYIPQFGHLPYVMGAGNKKLSKRDPESNIFLHRERGFIPEGLLNYLSLLGWSLSADEDIFTVEQLIEKFDVHDVLGNPARFDIKKAEAINGTHVRMLDGADFRHRLIPYLQDAGILGEALSPRQEEILTEAAPLIQERIALLGEAPHMLSFLFAEDEDIVVADDALKGMPENLTEALDAAIAVLEPVQLWTAETVQEALRRALVDELGLKPRKAFGPVRTAVSGQRISPPLFESMVILGKESSLNRIRAFRNASAS
ncbi:glutamate--tRNA ligase [Arthrobacter castelli]|uniref:glutamate--tRNA ligase n=1 Tax=Arthrobacter castelli TaxID=271431 RepID=UPI0004107FB9|nr:glutamate--tRNA ligase [Arthrobacter castelli]